MYKHAKVIKIGPRKEGKFKKEYDKSYKTRQIFFVTDTGENIHANITPMFPKTLEYQNLKVGDHIRGFNMLIDKKNGKIKRIIDPNSGFEVFQPNALF